MASSVGAVGGALYYRPRVWQTHWISSERVGILFIDNYGVSVLHTVISYEVEVLIVIN